MIRRKGGFGEDFRLRAAAVVVAFLAVAAQEEQPYRGWARAVFLKAPEAKVQLVAVPEVEIGRAHV